MLISSTAGKKYKKVLAIETTTPTISDSHSSAAGASSPSRENHENYFDMFLN
ncbi:hypothetical protein VXE32_007271 [Burkholderia cepacia]|nr:hypothetical protein [Burkholderia cepacia]